MLRRYTVTYRCATPEMISGFIPFSKNRIDLGSYVAAENPKDAIERAIQYMMHMTDAYCEVSDEIDEITFYENGKISKRFWDFQSVLEPKQYSWE